MVNEWVQKSIWIANDYGYLDKLCKIYPADVLPRRPLKDYDKQTITSLYRQNKSEELVLFLLGLTKRGHPFPIEHPYASILRQKSELITKNPEVFQRLERIVMSMTLDDIIRGASRPIDLNRVMGQAFQTWLREYFPKRGIPILPLTQFQSYDGGAFFDGRNAEILDYVNRRLGYSLERGRDFLYKIGDTYIVGEARFLSTSGGSQTRDLIETIEFVKRLKGKVIGVGVIDGIVWFNRSYVNRLLELKSDENVLSVLLLEEFLKSFG